MRHQRDSIIAVLTAAAMLLFAFLAARAPAETGVRSVTEGALQRLGLIAPPVRPQYRVIQPVCTLCFAAGDESLQDVRAASFAPQADADDEPLSGFFAVDVLIDSGAAPLGAYQVELRGDEVETSLSIVGVEGGEHEAFASPPYYDPAALQPGANGRLIIGAFSTRPPDALPTGESRVARVHIHADAPVSADRLQELLTLTVAADADGAPLPGARATATPIRP